MSRKFEDEFFQFVLFIFLVVFTIIALSAVPVDAVEPTEKPGPVLNGTEWPCYGEGWTPGDKWGPGKTDFIPLDTPPCWTLAGPEASGLELGISSDSIPLPATDTAP